MGINLNAALAEQAKFVFALPSAVPSSSAPTRVSLKNYERVCVLIEVKNATTVTGSAITLKQATDVTNSLSDEKAISFTSARRNIDTGAGDALSTFTVSGDTFTTDSTNSKNLMYVIDFETSALDVNNGFDCFRVGTADATAATVTVTYILYGARYSIMPTSLTN